MRRSRPLRRAPPLASVLAAAALGFAPIAHAQSDADRESAQALFAEGNNARNGGNVQAAVAKYKVAYALVQTPVIGLALGRGEVDLGQLVEARQILLGVERIPPLPNESARSTAARAEAKTLAAELASRIPTITLKLAIPASAAAPNVSIDGNAIPQVAREAPRKLDPGHHVAVATLGAAKSEASFDLAPGETREVPLPYPTLAPAVAAVPAVAPESSAPPAHSSSSRIPAYVALGVGGAGVVVTTVFGILALGSKSTLNTACGTSPTACPPSDVSSLSTNATVSDIGLGVAIAGIGVGGLLLFLHRNDNAPKSAGAHVSPWMGLGAAGLRGSF